MWRVLWFLCCCAFWGRVSLWCSSSTCFCWQLFLSSTAFCCWGAALPLQDSSMQVTSERNDTARYLSSVFYLSKSVSYSFSYLIPMKFCTLGGQSFWNCIMLVMKQYLLHLFLLKSSTISEVENGIAVAWIKVLGWCSFRRVMTVWTAKVPFVFI